jgi:microcystin-dependent protein
MADRRRNLGIPSGVVFPFAGEAAPYGYLICDGRAVSRTDYPALFISLGSGLLHGAGDGSTTFNLPDYRGKFMRGVDGVAGNDIDKAARTHPVTGAVAGNVVGSVQGDAIRNITGSFGRIRVQLNGVWTAAGAIAGASNVMSGDANGGAAVTTDFDFSASRVVPTASDNRPKNVNVNYIVKV